MRFVIALAVLVLAALQATAAAAQAPAWYWCEPARAYYPYVAQCPMPWRAVDPTTVLPRSPGQQPEPLSPAAALPPSPGPATAPKSFQAQGDALDEWCRTVKLPSSIAICSDPELRALALERQRAYAEARSRLVPDQQKALLADQNGWVKTYPVACGLAQDAPPSLPLAPTIKDCMSQAGRARIKYLRAYGTTATRTESAPNCRQHYDAKTGQIYYGCEPSPQQPPTPAPPPVAPVPIVAGIVCQNWDALSKGAELARSGDNAAFRQFMAAAFALGDCTTIRPGDQIYLVDVGVWTNSVKVRPKGQTVEYWGYLDGKPDHPLLDSIGKLTTAR